MPRSMPAAKRPQQMGLSTPCSDVHTQPACCWIQQKQAARRGSSSSSTRSPHLAQEDHALALEAASQQDQHGAGGDRRPQLGGAADHAASQRLRGILCSRYGETRDGRVGCGSSGGSRGAAAAGGREGCNGWPGQQLRACCRLAAVPSCQSHTPSCCWRCPSRTPADGPRLRSCRQPHA